MLLVAACSACSGVSNPVSTAPSVPPVPTKPAPQATPDLLQQLRAEIGTAACDSAKQCKTIPVGHKACGGPETFLAWSSKGSDGAKLQRLADAYGAKRKAENLASGMLSNCSAVMDPGATCSAGRCVTGGADPAI